MKIMLVQPKTLMRPMDTKLKTLMAPSLALLTLINLTPEKHEIFIVNENIEDIDFNADVELVGISVTVDVFNRAVEIAKKFKERNIPTVAGGIHISACPEMAEGHFDSICTGMAERVWTKMLEDAENGCLKKVYCDMSGISGEEIVSPAYDKIDTNKYFYTNILSTSRGCPFRCDFCYNSSSGAPEHIKRPVEDVIKDIKALHRKHVMFVDDNFIGDINWAKEFCKTIMPMKIKWNCAVSANILNHPDLMDLMKESGCQSLFIGLESLNSTSLTSVHKVQNNINNYDLLVEEIHKRGMMINASLVFGLDEDDNTVFKTTLDWMVKHKIETVTSHILTPYPGTKLFERLKAENRITDFDYSHYNTANVVYAPKNLTPEELYNGYLWFYREFYSVKNILKRLPETKEQWMAYFLFNFVYRKYGKLTEFISNIIPLHLIGKIISKLCYK